MSDLVDLATDRAAEQLQDALALQRRLGARLLAGDSHSSACEGCERLIPQARRQALPGVRLCVQCQTNFERGFQR